MKTKQQKNIFIESLRKTPIIQLVCERTGISRTTYYRWRKDDAKFALLTDDALREGIFMVNDLAESQLISSIKDKNMTGITYWLNHRHPDYANKLKESPKEYQEQLTVDQIKLLIAAIRLTQNSNEKSYGEIKDAEQSQ